MIRQRCPQCQLKLKFSSRRVGMTVSCPRCGAEIKLAAPESGALPDSTRAPRSASSKSPEHTAVDKLHRSKTGKRPNRRSDRPAEERASLRTKDDSSDSPQIAGPSGMSLSGQERKTALCRLDALLRIVPVWSQVCLALVPGVIAAVLVSGGLENDQAPEIAQSASPVGLQAPAGAGNLPPADVPPAEHDVPPTETMPSDRQIADAIAQSQLVRQPVIVGSGEEAPATTKVARNTQPRDIRIADQRLVGLWGREHNGLPEVMEFRSNGTYTFAVDMQKVDGTFELTGDGSNLRLSLSAGHVDIPVAFPYSDVLVCDPRGGTETGVPAGQDPIELLSSRRVFRRGRDATVTDVRAATERRRSPSEAWITPESPDSLLVISPPDSRRGAQLSFPVNRFLFSTESRPLPIPDQVDAATVSAAGNDKLHGRRLDGRLLATSLDGRILVARTSRNRAEIWDVEERRSIAAVRSTHRDITSVHLSESGTSLVVLAGRDLALCDLNTPRLVGYRRFQNVEGVAVSSDGQYFAAGVTEGNCMVWKTSDLSAVAKLTNANADSPRKVYSHLQAIYAPSFSRDGRYFAFGADNGALRVWNTSDWSEVWTRDLEHSVQRVQFSPDGQRLYAAAVNGPQSMLTVWDIEKRNGAGSALWQAGLIGPQMITPILHGALVELSHDGQKAAVPVYHGSRRGQERLELHIANAKSGLKEQLLTLNNDGTVTHISPMWFHPSGRFIAVSFSGTCTWLMDVTSQNRIAQWKEPIHDAAFCGTSGEWLVTANRSGHVQLRKVPGVKTSTGS